MDKIENWTELKIEERIEQNRFVEVRSMLALKNGHWHEKRGERLLQFIISLTLTKLFFVSVKVLENNASKYQVSKLT